MRLTLMVLFLASLACAGPGGKADKSSGSDTGDADTDADTDADVGPCPVYSGIVSGRSWDWQYTDAQAAISGDASWTEAVDTFTPGENGAQFTLTFDGTYAVEGFDDYTISTTTTGHCNSDGAWITGASSHTAYTYNGTRTSTDSTTTYDSPMLTMPSGVGEGDTWTVDSSGVTTTNGTETPFSYSYSYEAQGKTSVTVPAGTFDAMEIEGANGGTTYTFWADATIGTVSSGTAELVSYR